jgi:ABC-type nitrate/sulfonate/bicarbonate transport system substrate-binding protein
LEICLSHFAATVTEMKKRTLQFLCRAFAALIVAPLPQLHAAQSKKLRLAFSAFAYANPPFWIAQDLKLFEKYGYDSELVYVGGARRTVAGKISSRNRRKGRENS